MKHYLGICLVLLTLTLIVLGTIYGCSVMADRTVDVYREVIGGKIDAGQRDGRP